MFVGTAPFATTILAVVAFAVVVAKSKSHHSLCIGDVVNHVGRYLSHQNLCIWIAHAHVDTHWLPHRLGNVAALSAMLTDVWATTGGAQLWPFIMSTVPHLTTPNHDKNNVDLWFGRICDLVLVVLGVLVVLVLVAFLLLPLQPLPTVVVDFQQGEAQLALVSQPKPLHHWLHLGQWLCHHPETVSQVPQTQFWFLVFEHKVGTLSLDLDHEIHICTAQLVVHLVQIYPLDEKLKVDLEFDKKWWGWTYSTNC